MARAAARRRVSIVVAACLAASLVVPAAASAAPANPGGDTKYIVTYKDRPSRADEHAVERLGGKVKHRLRLIDALGVELPRGQLKKLARGPERQGDRGRRHDRGPSTTAPTPATSSTRTPGASSTSAHAPVHQAGNTGQGIKVAVIDTGIDYIHDDPDDLPTSSTPSSSRNYAGGYDFFNNDADPMDDNGHGTHVAGILAAEKNGYLVVGVAPGVELYALKVLGAAGTGDYSGLIAALGWAVDHDIDVVNMSLGGHEVSAALQPRSRPRAAAGDHARRGQRQRQPINFHELLYGCPVAYPAAYPRSSRRPSRTERQADRLLVHRPAGRLRLARRRDHLARARSGRACSARRTATAP